MHYYWENAQVEGAWTVALMPGMLAFWTLLIAAIFWAVGSSGPADELYLRSRLSAPGGVPVHAERLLDNRLALGEIDPDECRTELGALPDESQSCRRIGRGGARVAVVPRL